MVTSVIWPNPVWTKISLKIRFGVAIIFQKLRTTPSLFIYRPYVPFPTRWVFSIVFPLSILRVQSITFLMTSRKHAAPATINPLPRRVSKPDEGYGLMPFKAMKYTGVTDSLIFKPAAFWNYWRVWRRGRCHLRNRTSSPCDMFVSAVIIGLHSMRYGSHRLGR